MEDSRDSLDTQGSSSEASPPHDLPHFFAEILVELDRHERELGGVKNFKGRPWIEKKVKAADFRQSYTDFEYVYLTVVGLARLHLHCEEIVRRNNGRVFTQNPGVQLLEKRTGMTMHADREGANHLLRTAPALLVEAFATARRDHAGLRRFFKEAFDRTADPCLEGRAGRILEYLNSRSEAGRQEGTPPWEEVSVQPIPVGATPTDVVGEHLRVFVNECTWRWAQERGLAYATAKEERQCDTKADDFARLCNAASFEAAMLARGVASEVAVKQWEVAIEGGSWSAYDPEVSATIEASRARGLPTCEVRVRSWMYQIDFTKMVQQNPKTGKEREVRRVDAAGCRGGVQVTPAELKEAIEYFVRLETLSIKPGGDDAISEEPSSWPQRVRCAVFDFDNTLLQSEAKKKEVMLRICAEFPGGAGIIAGVPTDQRSAAERGLKVTRYTIFEEFAGKLTADGYEPPGGQDAAAFGRALADRFSAECEAALCEADEVPGALKMLRGLKAAGLPTYINSATPQQPLRELLRKLGWHEYITEVLGAPSDKVANLRAVAAAQGLELAQLVHVGDGNNDCTAAEECGCAFIAVEGDAAFTGAVHARVSTMHEAYCEICKLARIAPATAEL